MLAEAPASVYRARGGAARLFRYIGPEALIEGPSGTGKTRAGLERAQYLADTYPGARILLARKTRASMTESVLQIFESKVLLPGSVLNRSVHRAHRQAYHYPNGSEIVVCGLDNPDRLMSTEYDAAFVFEATECTVDDLEKIASRLRNQAIPRGVSGGPRRKNADDTWAEDQAQEPNPATGEMPPAFWTQIVADCNPSYPAHWLNQRANAGVMHRILSRHADNPTVTAEYLARLDRLTGHRKARLRWGQWAAAEGLIYDRWDEAVFVRERPGVKWERAVVSIDEGYANPCSMGFWLIDGDGYPHRADEWYRSGELEASVVAQAVRYAEFAKRKHKLELEAVIVDPSAAKLIAALGAKGLPVVRADNDVLPGIASVQARLVTDDRGRPVMTISPRCKDWRQEIPSYIWQTNKDGTKRDAPVKTGDHAMDETRYFNRYLDSTSGTLEAFAL